MENLLIQNISISTIELAMLIMIISFLLILIAFFSNQKGIKSKLDKIEQNLSKINTLINEMNSGYGIIDKNLSSSKEDLTNINETIRSIQKDIGKKSDENLSEQNINKAVDLAKLGVDIKEISSKTGLSEEQIETLIKFHTEK
jgi:septal ring factor EnvC (AmiA/AmiB activator)|tara:strand:- start:16 stop:444 length:429 start_codon:yes stop_codon:yes gene_type:complete